jgi:hypothetical protein
MTVTQLRREFTINGFDIRRTGINMAPAEMSQGDILECIVQFQFALYKLDLLDVKE